MKEAARPRRSDGVPSCRTSRRSCRSGLLVGVRRRERCEAVAPEQLCAASCIAAASSSGNTQTRPASRAGRRRFRMRNDRNGRSRSGRQPSGAGAAHSTTTGCGFMEGSASRTWRRDRVGQILICATPGRAPPASVRPATVLITDCRFSWYGSLQNCLHRETAARRCHPTQGSTRIPAGEPNESPAKRRRPLSLGEGVGGG
jgi:hypothetical protein